MNDEQEHFSSAAERKSWKAAVRRLIWPSVALLILSTAQAALPAGQQPFGQPPRLAENPGDGITAMDPGLAKRQLLLLNVMRQKKLVADTNKLLKLAAELKSEIDAEGDSAALSPEQLHKVEEIEKLAKSVKQKMTLSLGDGPSLANVFP